MCRNNDTKANLKPTGIRRVLAHSGCKTEQILPVYGYKCTLYYIVMCPMTKFVFYSDLLYILRGGGAVVQM